MTNFNDIWFSFVRFTYLELWSRDNDVNRDLLSHGVFLCFWCFSRHVDVNVFGGNTVLMLVTVDIALAGNSI